MFSEKGFHILLIPVSMGFISTAMGNRLDIGIIAQRFYNPINNSKRQEVLEALSGLKNLKVKTSDIPESVLYDLEESLDNSSNLFNAKGGTQRYVSKSSIYYDTQNFFNQHRSALELLSHETYGEVYRAFFFSRFDFSPTQIRKLFLGLISGTPWVMWRNYYNKSSVLAPSVLSDVWQRFGDIVKQASDEGHLQGGIIDIEAAFVSVPFDFFIHGETKKNPLDLAFTTLTNSFIGNTGAVQLYKSPYLRLSPGNPYRENILSSLSKEDLSDKDMLLKWWEDVNNSSTLKGDIFEERFGVGVNGYVRSEKAILKSFIQSSFDAAKRAEDFEDTFNSDPFIVEVFEALKEDDSFSRAVDSIFSDMNFSYFGLFEFSEG